MDPLEPDEREVRGAQVTQLFERYLEAREGRRPIDREELLRDAGDAAPDLVSRIDAYEQVQRMAEVLGAGGVPDDPPATVGRFRIVRELGRGGLGHVWLAEDPALGRRVALKVLDAIAGIGHRERGFVLNEARSLARLEHPGVVRVFEVGDTRAGGPAHIVMEHLEGPTLGDVIDELRTLRGDAEPNSSTGAPTTTPATEDGTWVGDRFADEFDGDIDLPDEEQAAAAARKRRLALALEPYTARIHCLLGLAEALAYCHDRGVVHRDIKPSNVLFDSGGRAKFVDFGLAYHADRGEDARIDVTERLFATAAYAAPEQVESGRTGADPRSDLFSLGTLAYELFALKRPFERSTRSLTLDSVREARVEPLRRLAPGLPPDLDRVIHHCLERDPADRYPTAALLAADLRAILEHRPIALERPSNARLLRLWARRHRRALTIVGLGLAVVLVAVLAAHASAARQRWARLEGRLQAVDQRTAALEPGVEGGSGLGVLAELGAELLELVAEARELDRTHTQLWLFGASVPHVEASSHRWSRRVAENLAADEERSEAAGLEFQWVAWRDLVGLDARLVAGEAHQKYGTRGTLAIDPELAALGTPALYSQVLLGAGFDEGFRVYRPLEIVANPVVGSYRLIVWDAEGRPVREVETLVRSNWDPRRVLSPAAPRADAPRFADSKRTVWRGDPADGGPPPTHISVPAFRVTPHVTVREYRAFCDAVGNAQPFAVAQALDEELPAYVTWPQADAFCAWMGGRLPSAAELGAASDQGLDLRPAELPLHAEWTCDLDPQGSPESVCAFKYSNYASFAQDPPAQWVETTARDAPFVATVPGQHLERTGVERIGTAFRVANTDADRATFEAQGARD